MEIEFLKLLKSYINTEIELPPTAVSRIANFVVSSRLRFARIFIFNRKYKVPNFATDVKRRNVTSKPKKKTRHNDNEIFAA